MRVAFSLVALAAVSIFEFGADALAEQPSSGVSRASQSVEASDISQLVGTWTYRSFHNNPALVTADPATAPELARRLIFAEAVFTFEIAASGSLKGAIDWPGGGLDLQGMARPGAAGTGPTVEIVGTGRAGTDTADWEYDYRGQLNYQPDYPDVSAEDRGFAVKSAG